MGYHRSVLTLTLVATILMVVLGIILGAKYGAIGVAFAYMVPVVLLFSVLRIMAWHNFRQF
jgi:O-antigen/teichoic acid export membrane protein